MYKRISEIFALTVSLIVLICVLFIAREFKIQNAKKTIAEPPKVETVVKEKYDCTILKGTWELVLGDGLFSYEFDWYGNWTSRTKDGVLYQSGITKTYNEYEGLTRYDLYNSQNVFCDSIYFDGKNQFRTGDDGELLYKRIKNSK